MVNKTPHFVPKSSFLKVFYLSLILPIYASYWYRISKGTQYLEHTVLFQTPVPLESQAIGWQITHASILRSYMLIQCICLYTVTHAPWNYRWKKEQITKQVRGAALRDCLTSHYATHMLLTYKGKLKEESNNEFKSKKPFLKEGESQTLCYCVYH